MDCCGAMGVGTWMMWLWLAAATVLLVGVVVAGVVLWNRTRDGRGGGGHRALEVLEERFARGEIDREEFERRRRLLTSEKGG